MSDNNHHLRAVPQPKGEQSELVGVDKADRNAYWAWANLHDNEPRELRRFKAAYCGAYSSPEAWALELVLSLDLAPKLNAAVPDWFHPYLSIDLAAVARDFVASGEIQILRNPGGGVWVFDIRTAAPGSS